MIYHCADFLLFLLLNPTCGRCALSGMCSLSSAQSIWQIKRFTFHHIEWAVCKTVKCVQFFGALASVLSFTCWIWVETCCMVLKDVRVCEARGIVGVTRPKQYGRKGHWGMLQQVLWLHTLWRETLIAAPLSCSPHPSQWWRDLMDFTAPQSSS